MTTREKYLSFLMYEYWCNKEIEYKRSNPLPTPTPLPTYIAKYGKVKKTKNGMFDKNTCVVGVKIQRI
tara:strand:+ start:3495 stop:3698 length:204 start_codon:yes stop_codon:yes gene_type:complete